MNNEVENLISGFSLTPPNLFMRIISLLFVVLAFGSCQKECPTCEAECTDSIPSKHPVCTYDLSKGLVAYYPFNGSLEDKSGNSFHATAMNGAVLGADFLGRPSSAAQFDGVNDYLIVPPNAKFNTEEVSLSCIVMVQNINRRHALITRLNFDNVQSFIYGLSQSLDSDNKWSFGVADNNENCNVAAVYDRSKVVYSSDVIQAGRWYNVVATFGKDGEKIFIDGKQVGHLPKPFSTLKKCTAASLVIGGWWQNDIISINGKMDEVRVYDRVITQCEIDKLAEIWN